MKFLFYLGGIYFRAGPNCREKKPVHHEGKMSDT